MNTSPEIKTTNVEEDRLSSLPHDLIHKILSFIGIKQVVQTSALSSRWRFIWTSMPYLNFSTDELDGSSKLSESVTNVLSRRDNQVEASYVNLRFHGKDSDVLVEQIMKYAFSHNIQQLNVACLLENDVEFPLFLFTSQSLKHLSLTVEGFPGWFCRRSFSYFLKDTSMLEFPSLTTLYLHNVDLCCEDENSDKCIGFFSKCANLKNLTIKSCYTEGFTGLSICLPLLTNLTIDEVLGSVKVFDVVAPQLMNITIKATPHEDHQYIISAPNLIFLLYKGFHCLQLSTDGFLSLEKADICVTYFKDADQVVCLFQQLHTVRFLTLSLEMVEGLSTFMQSISHQPSPFNNLKSLKIHPIEVLEQEKDISLVKNYLLDGSPGATITMVSREEVRAMNNTKFIQVLMTDLRMLLEHETTNMHEQRELENKTAKMHEQRNVQIGKYMNRSWECVSAQIDKGKEKVSKIIYMLEDIKDYMSRLPASKRATIQPSFSTLCAEAETVVSNITGRMKMQYDEYYNRLGVCFHDLATIPELTP